LSSNDKLNQELSLNTRVYVANTNFIKTKLAALSNIRKNVNNFCTKKSVVGKNGESLVQQQISFLQVKLNAHAMRPVRLLGV